MKEQSAAMPPAPAASTRRRHWRLLAACIGTMSLPDVAIWLRPAVTFEIMDGKGYSEDLAGIAVTAEILAFSVTMLLCARFAQSIRFRSLALIGFALSVVMSLASIMIDIFGPLVLARIGAAIGFGILTVVPYAAAARLPDAQKAYGYLFTGGNLLSFLVLSTLPVIQARTDHSFPFIAYIGFAVLMVPFVLLLPGDDGFDRHERDDQARTMQRSRWRKTMILSVGFAILAISFQGIWAFFYSLAAKVGMEKGQISMVMALTTLSSIGGSLLSARMSRLLGRNSFVYVAICGTSACLLAMLYVSTPFTFTLCGCLVMFLLFAFYPALFGIAAQIDESGRGASFLQGAGMLVGATGPFLAGLLFDANQIGLLMAGITLLGLIGLVIFALTLRVLPPPGKDAMA